MAIASEIDWDNLPVIDSNTPVGGTGEIDWDNLPVVDDAPAQSAAHSPRMTREERIAANNRAIETARSQKEPGFLSVAGEAIAEGAKGAARAVKSVGSGIVGMASGAVRLAGTPVRLATGWEGLHRLADTIDSSYENFGADALMSDYGENPDGFGFAAGRFGEKLAGTAGSLAALGGVGKAVGAAGTALKAAGHAKTAAAVANTLPLMFGNDAAVRAYDTARANGRSKTEAASLAGLNGAIHFLGFKAFENKALNKMLGMPAEMEGLMPKWAGEAAEAGGQSFSSLARGVRNGMIKYTLAERGKGALRAGGIMGLQNFLSDPVMQVAEGASIDDIDFSRMLKAGAEGVGEGALMEGALGAAAVLKSPAEARKFIADKYFRGKDYKVMGADGKMHDEPGLLNTSEGRMVLMKQNPDATERVLDIVEHGGTPRPAELDAAFLPPDMTAEELKKFASDWRNDLKPYVDEAWAADAPRQTAAPDAAAAEPGRDMLSPEEAQSQQKAANDAAERQKLADRRAAADSMMLDFESWNRLYADGKTDLNFDEWRAAGKPGVIEANLTPKTEEAPTSETRANEEPAQPEQGEVVAPPAGAEARPVESAEARAEAADARVVEPPAVLSGDEVRKEMPGYDPKNWRTHVDRGNKFVGPRMEARFQELLKNRKGKGNGEVVFLAGGNGSGKSTFVDGLGSKADFIIDSTLGNLDVAKRQIDAVLANGQKPVIDFVYRTPEQALDGVKYRVDNGGHAVSPLSFADSHTKGIKNLRLLSDAYGDKISINIIDNSANGAPSITLEQLEAKGIPDHAELRAKANEVLGQYGGALDGDRGQKGTVGSSTQGQGAQSRAESPVEGSQPRLAVEAEDTPLPSFLAPETAPAKETPAVKPAPKSNRLRRADGTDPLAEKSMPKTLQKAVYKISSAIANRTGTGVITPDEAYGIVKGIAESPGTKHNRTRDFFGPLEKDAAWHESMGLDAESAKNIRDAFDRVKADADLKKWFPQVDSAVKKAKDGKLSRADAVPLFGKISEGLEKAERMGLSEAANRLREAAEVIRPVAEAVTQGDVGKFNYSTKGRKLNNRLGGTDKRGGKTVSLDTKNGTVDVGADGKTLDEVIDEGADASHDRRSLKPGESYGKGFTGEERDAGGEVVEAPTPREEVDVQDRSVGNRRIKIETEKGETNVVWRNDMGDVVRRAPLDMLEKAAKKDPAIKDLIERLKQGEQILASKSAESPAERDLRFASDENYQKWLKSRKANDAEPLRERYEQEQAKAAKSITKNALPGVDVEIVDRAFNPETDGGIGKRKSIGGIFTGGPNDYADRSRQGGVDDGPSLLKIGTGEGSQVYGWGLYGSTERGVAEHYANRRNLIEDLADAVLEKASGSNEIALDDLRADKRLPREDRFLKMSDEEIDIVEKYIKGEDISKYETGNLYEQTFFTNRAEGDESHLLKWYEPVSEENAERIDAISRQYDLDTVGEIDKVENNGGTTFFWGGDRLFVQGSKGEVTGGVLYNLLQKHLGSPKAASEFLARAGIDGVKYPVDSYGGKTVKDGDKAGWNYVSFRDDNIRVDHKWKDGRMRYLRDGEGRVVGTFDRSTNKVTLYRGASAATLVHELGGHATLRFAEQEAERGNRQLLDRINRAIDEAPQALKDEIRRRYPKVDEAALRDEIWAALRERNSPAMEKAIKTLQGKAWYNRAWSAFRDAWKGLLARMGFNRADLSQIDRMSNDEFLSHLDRIMSDGKTLGRLEATGEGMRNADVTDVKEDTRGLMDQYGEPQAQFPGSSSDSVSNPPAESQGDVREARSPRPAGSRIMDDQQTKGEKFTEKFIDSLAPVKSVQEELGGVKEVTRADGYTDHTKSTDLVAAKDKANGRLEHEVRQHQFRVDDINRDLSRAALPKQSTEDLFDDFNLYLQCKHAPERNLSVAQDRGDTYTPDYSEGMGQITLPGGNRIGLSEKVADRLLRGMRGKYGLKIRMFENAADKVYKMLEADLDRRFDAGRLSAEDYAFYKTRWHGPGGADGKWAHYVPLKTDMERLEPEALNSSTAGMKRNEFMKAQGRGTGDIADSPLAAAVLQTEQGIRGSVRNEVANVEANLVEHAQRQGIPIAEIVPGDEIRRGRTYSFTFADGETVDASGSMRLVENHPEIHLFKRDGKLYAIRYDKGANGRGLAFAKAASGENMSRWGQGTEWIPRMTHWMSAMRTQYSPEFTVSNWLADHLEAAQALIGRYGLKEGGKAFAKTVASEIQNRKDLRAYLKDGTANGYIKEFVEGGGLTKGGVASEGFDAETQKIRSKIEQFRREQKQWREMSPADLAKSLGRNVTDFLSFANELAEYSTRTGLYTALRKQGVPQAEAIKFARDATVNFNRKGTAMPYINGLYMFANASVQGAVRSVQAMRDAHGKELIAALTAIGVAKAVIDNYLGNDDEREAAGGRNARNQSEYDKKHNVGVPIGGGRQIVPLRFRGPYAAVPYLAQTAANVAMGVTSPEDGAKTLFRELGDQVTDLVGGNGIMNDRGEFDGALIGQSIAPSSADWLVQLATGKDYKGDELRRKSFDKTMPASSNGKRSTSSFFTEPAKFLNRISGGNEHRKGLVDVAPEDLQLVLEFLLGAPMRDANNVASSVNNAIQFASGGTPERTLSQIPLVRRVVREYPESTSRYYDALENYERDKAEFKKTTPERRREMKSEKPYLFMGKSLLDGQIERIKELTHLERGEVKVGQKWVEPKTPRTEEQKEKYRKLRLEMQARVLKRLGE